MVIAVSLTCAGTVLAAPPSTASTPAIYSDGRDHFNLLDRRLVNRQLFEQLQRPEQWYRIGRNWDNVAFAVNGSTGSQQTPFGGEQSRFHGWYLLDSYAALRPFAGFDANLNLLMLNPSASDGFRVSSQINAGVALHYRNSDIYIAGRPLQVDILGSDLGLVTYGQGLLLEQWPIEGEMVGVAFDDFYLRHSFAGRGIFNDDMITLAAGWLDGQLELFATHWLIDHRRYSAAGVEIGQENWPSWYLNVSGFFELDEMARVSAEYSRKVDTGKNAALARADLMSKTSWFEVHGGYQFRYYQQGFGPARELMNATSIFNTPYAEDRYVTNAFEYLGLSSEFEQWSHSVMLETTVPVAFGLSVFGAQEYWVRFLDDRQGSAIQLHLPDEGTAPGRIRQYYYSAGLRFHPWRQLPHRLQLFITNKQVSSRDMVTDPNSRRFDPGDYIVLELEAEL